MYGAGVFGAEPGRTTDDTAQAAALSRVLIKKETFDPTAFADRLVDWYEDDAFGVGSMTRRSIQQLRSGESWHYAGKNTWLESEEGQNAGNGSIMRCAPLALAYACGRVKFGVNCGRLRGLRANFELSRTRHC